jgi:hypothetical protein
MDEFSTQGRKKISFQVSGFSVRVSGFWVWGLLTPHVKLDLSKDERRASNIERPTSNEKKNKKNFLDEAQFEA